MKNILTALRVFLVLSILTGIVYPVAMTLLSESIFTKNADGSLIVLNGKLVGSSLLAQKTTDAKYFWPRPSAGDYATVSSGASNQGILSKSLADAVAARREALGNGTNIPPDLLYASGSGLDPHISPEAARYQIARVAAARHYDANQMEKLTMLVEARIERPQFGIFGDPRVNVLELNLAVDQM
ncbi:MAG: potassium-transporting ATPase subunit KdpC [Chthoniobacterales bacterium]